MTDAFANAVEALDKVVRERDQWKRAAEGWQAQTDREVAWRERLIVQNGRLVEFVQKMWLELDNAADAIGPVPDLVERNLRFWHREAEALLTSRPSPPTSDPEGERLADGSRPYPKSSDSALPAPSTEAA